MAAAHGALHGRGPAGGRPRAGQQQAGDVRPGRRAQRPVAGGRVEGRGALPGDEEVQHLGPGRGRQQPLQLGQVAAAQLGDRQVDLVLHRGLRERQVLGARVGAAERGGGQAGVRGAVEDPLDRGAERGEERPAHQLAVVDHVHVEDRRGAEVGQPVLPRDRVRRQQGGRAVLGAGQDDGVGGEQFPAVEADGVLRRGRLELRHPGAQQHLHAQALQLGDRPVVVDRAERGGGDADVGGARVGEQTGLEHLRRERHRDLVGPGVQGGDADQVPQGRLGGGVLPVAAQPLAEGDPVQRRVGEVQALQGERAADDPGAVGRGQVRVAGEAARQVERDGQAGPLEPSEGAHRGVLGPGDGEHRDVEAVLQVDQPGGAEPLQQASVGGAAPQVDVLAVVDGQLAALEGERQAAEPGPPLGEGDPVARLGQAERGGDPGQTAADHDGGRARGIGSPGHRSSPSQSPDRREAVAEAGTRSDNTELPARDSPLTQRDRSVARIKNAPRRARKAPRTPSPSPAARRGRAAPTRGRRRSGRAAGGRSRPSRRCRHGCGGRGV